MIDLSVLVLWLAPGNFQRVSRGGPPAGRLLPGHDETRQPRAGEAGDKARDVLAASTMRVDHGQD